MPGMLTPPQGMFPAMLSPNPADAERARFYQWLAMRDSLPPDDPLHDVYGPREHGAYAELRTREYPIYGALEQLLGIPAWTGGKALGLLQGRSAPSLDEMAEGYRGLGRGMWTNLFGE